MIRAIQTNLSREKPLFTKLSEKFDDSVSSLRSSSCFENQILSYPHLHQICQGNNVASLKTHCFEITVFANVFIAIFTAITSRILIWYFIS